MNSEKATQLALLKLPKVRCTHARVIIGCLVMLFIKPPLAVVDSGELLQVLIIVVRQALYTSRDNYGMHRYASMLSDASVSIGRQVMLFIRPSLAMVLSCELLQAIISVGQATTKPLRFKFYSTSEQPYSFWYNELQLSSVEVSLMKAI